MKFLISQNGVKDLLTPSTFEYSVIFIPENIGTATLTLKMFGTPLQQGNLVAGEQVKIHHGQGASLQIEVEELSIMFEIHVLGSEC